MQGNLFDDIPEARFWESVVDVARKKAKQKLPMQLEGESREEYYINLRDETRLEFAAQLRFIADEIERRTLERQKNTIDLLWKIKHAVE